jgi:hypothetical protein
MSPRTAGSQVPPRDAGDQHEQATATVARDSTRCDLPARRPEWVTPARAQLESELKGLVAMLGDDDVDALVNIGIELWVSASHLCVDGRAARPDA